MKRFNSFWVYALVLAVFVALIVWRMQRQAATPEGAAATSTPDASPP